MDCMGGFVVTVLYGFSRETSDLDVLVIAPREQRTPLLPLAQLAQTGHARVEPTQPEQQAVS